MSDEEDEVIDAKNGDEKKPKASPTEPSAPQISDPNHDLAARLQNEAFELRKREKLDKEPYVKELKARIKELESQLIEALAGADDSGDTSAPAGGAKAPAESKKKK